MGRWPEQSLMDRLMSKVVWNGDEDECWEWQASKDGAGYGQIKIGGRPRRAHRVAYELFVAPIPDGHELDHLCRNPICLNPAHLEPVTHAENLRRGRSPNREKTRCPKGHPYSGDNLLIDNRGRRVCVRCKRRQDREGQRRYRAKRKAPK